MPIDTDINNFQDGWVPVDLDIFKIRSLHNRVSDPDLDPQDPHVFALPGSGSWQKGKEMNE